MVPSNNICLEEYLRHYGVNHHHDLGTSNVKNFIFLDVQQSKLLQNFSFAFCCNHMSYRNRSRNNRGASRQGPTKEQGRVRDQEGTRCH